MTARSQMLAHADGVTVKIRAATLADAAAIAALYNEGIAERQATFETRPREPEEIAPWFEPELPFLIADVDGQVVGFARVSLYTDRCVYAGVGEHGVYVDAPRAATGLGRRLLEALARAAEDRGLYELTSRVFTSNAPSLAVHRAAGFEEVGVQRRHGRLDGQWKDCVLASDCWETPLTTSPPWARRSGRRRAGGASIHAGRRGNRARRRARPR